MTHRVQETGQDTVYCPCPEEEGEERLDDIPFQPSSDCPPDPSMMALQFCKPSSGATHSNCESATAGQGPATQALKGQRPSPAGKRKGCFSVLSTAIKTRGVERVGGWPGLAELHNTYNGLPAKCHPHIPRENKRGARKTPARASLSSLS